MSVPSEFWGGNREALSRLRGKQPATGLICGTQKKSVNSAVVSSASAAGGGGDELCSGVGTVGAAGITACALPAAQISNFGLECICAAHAHHSERAATARTSSVLVANASVRPGEHFSKSRVVNSDSLRRDYQTRQKGISGSRIKTMSLRINDEAPNFIAQTTQGELNFHEWIGAGWAILFSHPKDFTPVCTTELGYMAAIQPEFEKRNCKVIGLSVDPVASHHKWEKDIEETQGHKVNYPMIGDSELKVAKLYNILPADAGDRSDGRTAAANGAVRSVFVIGPDKKIKLTLSYPMSTGRNFDEILRALDSIQLTAKHKVATPVNWKNGDDVIIVPAVSDEEAKHKYPNGWKAPKPSSYRASAKIRVSLSPCSTSATWAGAH
jgi:thioredoxin-dependent peroxiredoxin